MEDEEQAQPVGKRLAQWINQRPGTTAVAYLLAVAVFIITYWAILADSSPPWTGFGAYDEDAAGPRAKTFWDWLGLLIVPAALAAGAYWLNKSQKETELKIAEKAREKDREIAEKTREKDREIAEQARAIDRESTENARKLEREIAAGTQRQATLEAYYDRMTVLLLEHKLRESAADSEVRSIARARTIAVVRRLDGERNGQLFPFLIASRLMELDSPIIDLTLADLSNADLSRANLSKVNLSQSNLRRADLSEAILREANLTKAILIDAKLSQANLSQAKLGGAILNRGNLSVATLIETDLVGTDLSEADLSGSNLRGSDLTEANLSRANLNGASLGGTNLSGATLDGVTLTGANLIGANLSGASLNEAKFTGADLSDANLSKTRHWIITQFDQASLLEGTIMPDGVKLSSWSVPGPTYAEWKAQYLAKQG